MAGKAEHKATRQPGSRAGTARQREKRVSAPAGERARGAAVGMDSVAAAVLVCAPDGTDRRPEPDGRRTAARRPRRQPSDPHSATCARGRAPGWTRPATEIRPADVHRRSPRLLGTAGRGRGRRSAGRRVRTSVWLRISAEPLLSPAGELEDVVLTLVDITSLKETRDALREVVCRAQRPGRDTPGHLRLRGRRRHRPPRDRRRGRAGPGVPGVLTGEGVGAPVWESLSEDAAAQAPQGRRPGARHRQARDRRDRHGDADGHPLRRGAARAARRRDAAPHRARHHREQARGGGAAPERGEVPHAVPAHAGDAALDRRGGPAAERQRPLAAAARLHRRRGARATRRPSS